MAPFFERLVEINGLSNCHYIEPYAGGASLALSLLFEGWVARISLNDIDPAIYSFWHAAIRQTDDFIELIRRTPVTVREWERQKTVYKSGRAAGRLALGFATFFLNRTNHSGILNGGMIGGREQRGLWRIDARYNKASLVDRVRRLAAYRRKIGISNHDAMRFLNECGAERRSLIYLDPPYARPARLYLNEYDLDSHRDISKMILRLRRPWVVSYDDVPEIRQLYADHRSRKLKLLHSARHAQIGSEVMFFSQGIRVPRR